MAATFLLSTGVVYVRSWTGTLSGGLVAPGDGTVTTPAYGYASQAALGFYKSSSFTQAFGANGVNQFTIATGGLNMRPGYQLGWASGDPTGVASDTTFTRTNAGIVNLTGGAATTFQLGGTTASFPALKQNGASLEVKLADDSLFANLKVATFNLTGAVQTVAGVTTAGTFGVSPIVAVAQATGLTNTDTNRINYTPAAASSTYCLNGVVNVTAWTTPASFTIVATYKDASGNARTDTAGVIRGSTGATAAAVTAIDRWYFEFPAIDIDNSATAITLSTTGTFTGSPVYNIQGTLIRIR